ncbi:sensor histidine kinase [Sphingomicrobium clamense]|uniref:Histidine kinase n=1 Tax=Sphingomicrobium clamense TaxID=2851013 RepID=A0ABS6V2E5_9SPHN|nr:histidine kinase [Sphingomicrobium sp. B8]MBW0143727.1 histidine kinase [Sphingomicrobium sp. B8]
MLDRERKAIIASEPVSSLKPGEAVPSEAPAKLVRQVDEQKGGKPAPILEGVGLDEPFFADKNRAFWLLQSLGWSGFFLLRSLSGIANSMGAMFVVHCLLLTATGYSITLLMASLYRRLIVMKVGVTAVATLVTVLVAALTFSFIETWSLATFVNPNVEPNPVLYLAAISLDFTLLAAWSALYYGINYYLLLEEQIDQRSKLESQASAAQLAMLRYQLNPHFLFNTLNSISTLVLLKQVERANAMLARLSSFLRYTLVNEPTAKVPLAKEVETLKLYLDIEKMRFEERLRPHFRIDADTVNARLPSLLLQPLMENAIKYAVTPSEEGADIWVTARREGQAVRIEVADSGPGSGGGHGTTHSTGVGLVNIKDRLAQAYGPAHGFRTKQNDKGGFSVILEIPYETEDTNT